MNRHCLGDSIFMVLMTPAFPPPAFPAPFFMESNAASPPPTLAPTLPVQKKPSDRLAFTHSRSTSAGSLSIAGGSVTPSSNSGDCPEASQLPRANKAGFPAFERTLPPYIVRNTFIDTTFGRPPSLDGFFVERQVRSCPGSSASSCIGSDDADSVEVTETRPAYDLAVHHGELLTAAATAAASVVAADRTEGSLAESGPAAMAAETVELESFGAQKQVLRLNDALREPKLGSPELPTVGSASHRSGNCKPCAFAHTKGCGNGADCQFCHLCEPGEKKRRQKEKFERRRQASRWHDPVAGSLRTAIPKIF